MKLTLEQIKIFASLLKENEDLILTCKLMEGIYHISLQEILERLNRGEKVEVIVSTLYNSKLFEELILFYSYTMPLYECLNNTVNILERLEQFKKNLISMMIYPMILILSLLAFSIFAIIYIKPQFMNFYNSFGIELSSLHSFMINSLFMLPVIIMILIGAIAYIALDLLVIITKNDYAGIMKRIQIPVLSKIIQIYLSVKFSLYYGEFIQQGVSIYEMLEFLKEKVQSPLISIIAYEIEIELLKGKEYEKVIEDMIYFDDYFKLTIHLSQSIENEKYLIDQYFENTMNKISHALKMLQRILTPFTYFLVGLYIVGIYALMVIPMTNMISEL